MSSDRRTALRLGGISEVAAVLNVSRQQASILRQRGTFPTPVGKLASGPVWDLDEISLWDGSGLRRGPGRPPARDTIVLDDRFELEEAIGSGGFADVYRALDRRISGPANTVVAVKVLRELDDKEVRARFARELRLVREIAHPNVVPILDFGEDEDGPIWYAMPLAQGSLADERADFIGNDSSIVDLFRQLCAGLSHVHKVGIYHRDLKPENILRLRSGTWAISDFGLAREKDRRSAALTSTLRTGFGTYVYAAPEVWKGAKYATATADIFSLGKVLQELLTGDPPAPGTEPQPHHFSPVVRKATRAAPADRYQTADAFLQDLETLAAAPRGTWQPSREIVIRLYDRLRDAGPDLAAVEELFELALRADDDGAAIGELRFAIPLLGQASIEHLWRLDSAGFRRAFANYADYVSHGSYGMSFCDDVADFCDRAVQSTGDVDVLRAAVAALICLARGHDLWRVRDVLVTILQRIRTPDDALAALDGIRQGRGDALRWAFTDFTLRTLHPLLKEGIEELLSKS